MKRHESLVELSRFHRSCLFLALVAKPNAPIVKGYPTDIQEKIGFALDFHKTQLTPHFAKELTLWNWVRNKSERLEEVISVLVSEREKLNTLFTKIELNKDEEILNEIGILLEVHVRKEERVLFQQIQSDLTEKELQHIPFLLS